MKTQAKFAKLAILAAMGGLLLTLSTSATAESDAARAIRASAATVPTNIPGIRTYAEPPNGFNPVMASDEELATYGFPPRPDKQAHPEQYAEWERAMKRAKIRWNGELKPLPSGGHRMTPVGSSPVSEAAQPEAAGPNQILTNNASGAIVKSGQKSFNKNSIEVVSALITVPTVEEPLETTSCATSGYAAISAVGIDGFVTNTGNGYAYDPQLEAGVFEQIYCNGDIYYFAVVGWQGNYNVVLEVNPGDVIAAQTYTFGGSTSYEYIEDYTTLTYEAFSVTTPGIIGAAANWIVERFCCVGNEPIALANTTDIAFGGALAEEPSGKYLYPGSQARSTEVLTMTDDAGNESIELVTQGSGGAEGLTGLWFSTSGCAFDGGCTP
jgi:hypothetical protein